MAAWGTQRDFHHRAGAGLIIVENDATHYIFQNGSWQLMKHMRSLGPEYFVKIERNEPGVDLLPHDAE
jgi:hypothetical protein